MFQNTTTTRLKPTTLQRELQQEGLGGWGSGAVEHLGRKTKLALRCTCSLQSLWGSGTVTGMLQHRDVLLGKDFGDTHQHFAVGGAGAGCWVSTEHPCVQGALEPHGFRDSTCHVSVSLLPADLSWWQQKIQKIVLGCHS